MMDPSWILILSCKVLVHLLGLCIYVQINHQPHFQYPGSFIHTCRQIMIFLFKKMRNSSGFDPEEWKDEHEYINRRTNLAWVQNKCHKQWSPCSFITNNVHVNALLLAIILMTRKPPFYDNHAYSADVSPQNNCCIPQSTLCKWDWCLGDTNMQGLRGIRLYDVFALIVRKLSSFIYLVSHMDPVNFSVVEDWQLSPYACHHQN